MLSFYEPNYVYIFLGSYTLKSDTLKSGNEYILSPIFFFLI